MSSLPQLSLLSLLALLAHRPIGLDVRDLPYSSARGGPKPPELKRIVPREQPCSTGSVPDNITE
ncbi:hypothetical protein EYZ11_008162 [Aspergillus tanneri]|uniref:Uncharacterized protein n=1 Tax=Aspergillus tanneri TaxID=1220188 RepID=A0A4S3JBH1_9EURO|nr:hypothetical protein EYZ11_008162 [Aspergillus tanneri]